MSAKSLERLKAACEYSEVYTLADIEELLQVDGWELWEYDDCVVLTCLEQHAIGMCVEIVLAGGELEALKRAEAEIADYARSLGCKMLYINGRPGWQRALDGYTVHTVTMRRPL